MNYDLLIKGADIVTMNPDMPVAGWLAVNDWKIAAVGVGDDWPTEA